MNYQERKQNRTEKFLNEVYKKKLIVCTACNGSGYYDSQRSPKCECCKGTGKVKEK